MISGWLVKVIIGIALVGFAVVELGSPLVAKAQADDAAHQVANEVAFRFTGLTNKTFKEACDAEAEKNNVTAECSVNSKNDVEVRVTKEARSFLLNKFDVTKDWYTVEASASATPR